MANRTANSHAAFFQAYLRAGMQVLDLGCGPGTITLGFAGIVNPGTVTGVDRESSQVEIAQQNAAQQAIANVRFQVANIYQLPFPDNCFDAVFAHAVMEHLQQPLSALQELHRVLKPGGVIGLRSPDWGGFIIAAANPELEKAISYYKLLQQRNGGNPYVGRQLKSLLRQAEFTQIEASASYECYESLSAIAEYLALRIEDSATVDRAVEEGWVDERSLQTMSRALREWSQNPDGLFAQAWCEAVGYKN